VIRKIAPEVRGTNHFENIPAFFGAAVIFAVTLLFGAHAEAAGLVRWAADERLSFKLPTADGGEIALDEVRGNVVIVHFFATWCEPCREELPAFDRLIGRSESTVKVLAIAVAEPDVRVQRFVEATSLKLPVLLDRDRAVAMAWEVSTLPTSFVLDSALKPRLAVESEFAWDSVDVLELIARMSADDKGLSQQEDTATQRRRNSNGAR